MISGLTTRRRRAAALVLVGCLATLLAAGTTIATAGSKGEIHACVAKSNGAVRVANSCASNEKSLSWAAEGARGPRGAKGLSGAPVKFFYNGGSSAAAVFNQKFGAWTVSAHCDVSAITDFSLNVIPQGGAKGGTLQVQEMQTTNDGAAPKPVTFHDPVNKSGALIIDADVSSGYERVVGKAWVTPAGGQTSEIDFSVYVTATSPANACQVAGIATP